jgi:uncharacterized protein (DUF58 family)
MALADWMRIEQVSPTGRAEIGARRIYILPTSYGLIFGVLLFLMLLGAVNYANNPAHMLTFLLAAIGSNAIYQTWRNLRGLGLVCQGATPVFAGEAVSFVIDLDAGGRERPAIQLMFADSDPVLVDLRGDARPATAQLLLSELPRGLHRPGRLVVSTQYPVGLFRAWCYINCDHPVLVYPRRGEAWLPPGTQGESIDGSLNGTGNEDFAGLRGYQPGDQPSQIDWKSYARDRGLNTRLFSGQASTPLWIDWDDAPGADVETRLAALTRAVLDADANGQPYGLRTPDGVLEPAAGQTHRHLCLRHLALYGWDDA